MGFSLEFLKNPIQIGSPFPSSQSFAKLMVDSAKLDSKSTIIEPRRGTGSLISEIIEQLPSNVLLIQFKSMEYFTSSFNKIIPKLFITRVQLVK